MATFHEVAQYSEDWLTLAAGVPSASHFSEIATEKLKASASQEKYLDLLLWEWHTGTRHVDGYQNRAMERGLELEPEAMRWFEFHTGLRLRHGGWCTLDDGSAGCSPDFLVYDGGTRLGGAEMKAPEGPTHMGYCRGSQFIGKKYLHQVQGSLHVSGLQRWWTLSYHPQALPAAVHVVERDEAWIAGFAPLLTDFCATLAAEKARLLEAGYGPTA